MALITFDDKVQLEVNPVPDVNQFKADDANEIKTVVNANAQALKPTNWNHTSQGGAPTDLTLLYYATDPLEAGFPLGTLFWSDGAGGWFTK